MYIRRPLLFGKSIRTFLHQSELASIYLLTNYPDNQKSGTFQHRSKMNAWAIFLIGFMVVLQTCTGTTPTPSISPPLINCEYTTRTLTSSSLVGSCECQSGSEQVSAGAIDISTPGATGRFFICLDNAWRDDCGPITAEIERDIMESCCKVEEGTVTGSPGSLECEF